MSTINTLITRPQQYRLTQSDHSFFKQKLREHCLLNTILHRPYNRQLLAELECLLDRKPIPSRRKRRLYGNGKVVIRILSIEEFEILWKQQ